VRGSFEDSGGQELASRQHFVIEEHARREAARFIDVYNHRRRHSSCEMMRPVAYDGQTTGSEPVSPRACESRIAARAFSAW
jgi:hypothetical protein